MKDSKDPTEFIVKQQAQVKQVLPFADKRDFVNAERGLRGRIHPNIVYNDNGVAVWSNESYTFLQKESPDSANPSLWRQSRLAHLDGLFEVTPQIYQVRGLDLSNTTLIEGKEGLIVIDPLTSKEAGAAALALYQNHRGSHRPVKAVIFTHSHADHFGGVRGFIREEDIEANDIRILAPDGFLEHAVSENVFTGTAMSRRAAYMYGAALPQNARAQIGAGLGQTVSTGEVTLIAPNDIVKATGEKRSIDGVDMVFQMAPNTEAPAEMLIYFPQHQALCAAEDATHTFHNVLTLRGAVVRDPHAWALALNETIDLFGNDAKVVFASHHWPTWGNDEVGKFLTIQRDLYAYIHDQTLRFINQGYNGPEIAEMMTLPPSIDQSWSARGYYGSWSHNIKAVYQRYCGWFDGNPAHLWEHTPVAKAQRYAQLVGGVQNLIVKGRQAFDSGDFRWAAELLNHAVFADPANKLARNTLADTYEQLGYGSENGPWRNFFISGCYELRHGNFGTPTQTASADVIRQLTPEMLLDSIAIQINGLEAARKKLCIDMVVIDMSLTYHLWLSNGALIYSTASRVSNAPLSLTGTSKQLTAIAIYGPNAAALSDAGVIVEGDQSQLDTLASLLDPGDPSFNIVTP